MKIIPNILLALSLILGNFTFITNSEALAEEAANPNRIKKTSSLDEGGYLMGPEDILEVSIWKNEELSRVVVIRPDGRISLPLIGDLQAAGLTPEELKSDIEKALQEYQETTVASVIVQEINSYRVYMLGELRSPGAITLKRNTSILQSIALAGGFTQFASQNRILLIREGEKIRIRFDDLVKEGDVNVQNIILKPGDTIYVPGGTIFLP